jgi:hypothetical protein
MLYRVLLPALVIAACLAVSTAGAGVIEERVQDHVAEAVKDGVVPADFHHLYFALGWRQTFGDWSLAGRSLDRLAGAKTVDPLMVDEIRLLRAQLEVEGGHAAAARELFRTMGGLSSWWLHGPVALDELADFGRVAVPSSSDFSWRPTPGTDALGWVGISGLAWPPQRQMAYLATTVVSATTQPVAVRVGAAQVARVWLNGVEVLTTPQPLERAEDQAVGGGWLREGANLLVVAVASENESWWLRARLTRPDGSMLDGVSEVAQPPVVAAAVNRDPPDVRELGAEIRAAVEAGTPGATMALAAFHVVRRPEPIGGGGARAACRAARSEAPGEARLLEWIVTTEPGAARDLLTDAIEADPGLLWARLELVAWLAERDLFEAAYSYLEATATGEPTARAASLDLDAALWGPLAMSSMADLGRAYPACVQVNLSSAEMALEARRWDLAAEAVLRLGNVVPGMMAVTDLQQRLAERCGDGATLRSLLSSSLEKDPNQPEDRVRLARLLAADQDIEGARGLLMAGLERSPTAVDLMMELASVEHSEGDDERAAALAREVLVIRPQDRRAQRLLELLGERGENLDWLRAPDELRLLADAAPPASPAVAVLDHREVRFLPSRLSELRVQQAFLITSADRADELLVHHIPFVPEKERLRVLHARILHADGTEIGARQGDTPRLAEPELNMYYDTRLRVLRFADLTDGDLLEIAYILTEIDEANETGPYSGGLITLVRSIPVALMEVELAGPNELLPDWEVALLADEPEREEDAEGVVHLRWVWRGLPAIPTDTPPAPQLLVTPYLAYSNHPRWGDLADWYQRHVAPRVRSSDQVEETALRLVEGHDDRLDRIHRLYRFVTNDILYVALEFGEHRFRPFSADWVLHHRIGDCKDKAALLVALCDAIGVEARMVMVRTADLGPVATDLAVLEIFNHAIVYLPDDDLWLDGTATGHAPFPPPTVDQDAVVLVIDGIRSNLQASPVVGGGLSHTEFTLRASGNAMVEIKIHARDTGEAADYRRSRFAGSREPMRFARWLQEQFPGAELIGEPELHLIPNRDPARVTIEGTVARSALASAGGIRSFPGTREWTALNVPGGSRYGPLMMVAVPDLEWVLETDLGRPPKTLPTVVDLDTDYGALHIDFEALSSGYRVKGRLHLDPGLVGAADVAGLREFLIAVERHLDRPLESP